MFKRSRKRAVSNVVIDVYPSFQSSWAGRVSVNENLFIGFSRRPLTFEEIHAKWGEDIPQPKNAIFAPSAPIETAEEAIRIGRETAFRYVKVTNDVHVKVNIYETETAFYMDKLHGDRKRRARRIISTRK